MSARVRASATASLPEIRSSLSSAAAGAGLVATAMSSPPYTVLCCAFSPGIPAVISTPPWSRSATSSCSYWPRKRKPCERTVAFLSPIFSAIQLRYLSLSFRHISLAVFLRLAHGDRRDRHALPHLPPLGHLERVRDLGVTFGRLHVARLEPLVRLAGRGDLEVRAPLHLGDRLRHPVEREEGRRDLRERAQDPHLGVIFLVDPETAERGLGADECQP